MEQLLKNAITLNKHQTKIISANQPIKLEFLVNEKLDDLHKQGLEVVDIKYAINKDIGSALIIYKLKENLS